MAFGISHNVEVERISLVEQSLTWTMTNGTVHTEHFDCLTKLYKAYWNLMSCPLVKTVEVSKTLQGLI